MQSKFTTLDIQQNSYNINDRKNFGNKVVKINDIEVIMSLII